MRWRGCYLKQSRALLAVPWVSLNKAELAPGCCWHGTIIICASHFSNQKRKRAATICAELGWRVIVGEASPPLPSSLVNTASLPAHMVEPPASHLTLCLTPALQHLEGGQEAGYPPPGPQPPGRRRSGGAPGVSLEFDWSTTDLGREFLRTSSGCLVMLHTPNSRLA